ncbi:hypothetical protein ACGFYQ_09060 [Streptomyces sp. NPDC048258]|uniref:hypothetical protein n=1 Tax=Streptomyces sp. NPDC048258 TaxID=3365527 RepID=UPI003714E0F7
MISRLAAFLRAADAALDAWDLYSDEHTDLDGWPYDPDAYDDRKAERDQAVWAALDPVREEADVLLEAAEADLDRIAIPSVQTRWMWQLAQLRGALNWIEAAHEGYQEFRTAQPQANKDALQAAADFRNAEAWHALDTWMVHGRAVLEIHTATVRAAVGPRIAATPPPPDPSATAGHTTRR